ncbi:MAG: 4'-phosphopantetheinyl transferase superfamily protein [Deltaproteobacteria bacterium]|nr:4'-phosphopantetheinyl transferase superfamily protein [Deltaproteobacteria bacterium]
MQQHPIEGIQSNVTLYQVWLDAPPLDHPKDEVYEGWLTAEERTRLARFRVEKPRFAFLMGRATLRSVLGQHLQVDGRRIVLRENAYGRPELADKNTRLFFNLSHTSGLLALALSRDYEIGVDVECRLRSTDTDAIAEHVFAPDELAELRHFDDPSERHRHFFKLWTLKEAYIKARGMGLALPLKDMAFTRNPTAAATATAKPLAAPASAPEALKHDTFDFHFGATRSVEACPEAWSFGLYTPSPIHQMAVAARHVAAPRTGIASSPRIRVFDHYWPPPPPAGSSR